MRSREEVVLVLELVRAGWNDCEISRETGVPRQTILDWRSGRVPDFDRIRTRPFPNWICVVCRGDPATLPQTSYTYLLGLYLGDGYIASHARGVYRLRIYCANAYPELIRRCESAMGEVIATKVGRVPCVGCTEVASSSKHWPCLLPQHGPGKKHERRIELVPWQQELVDLDPRPLLWGCCIRTGAGCSTGSTVRRIPGTTSAMCRRTSGGSSGGHAISWGSSGGTTTRRACRWPGGGVLPCWTSSWGPSGEPGVARGTAAMTVRAGTRARQNTTFPCLVGTSDLMRQLR